MHCTPSFLFILLFQTCRALSKALKRLLFFFIISCSLIKLSSLRSFSSALISQALISLQSQSRRRHQPQSQPSPSPSQHRALSSSEASFFFHHLKLSSLCVAVAVPTVAVAIANPRLSPSPSQPTPVVVAVASPLQVSALSSFLVNFLIFVLA